MSVRVFFPALLPFLLGCGSSEAVVSGTVTLDGRPLRQGYITFFPTEGTANTCGAYVTEGTYQVGQMLAGSRRAVISSIPEVRAAGPANPGGGVPKLKILPSTVHVSPHTRGNQQVVEIRPGSQVLDFALQTPQTPR